MPVAAIAYALISAALFGASTPFAKLLLGELPPLLLAGLLYLGSGLGLLAWIALRPGAHRWRHGVSAAQSGGGAHGSDRLDCLSGKRRPARPDRHAGDRGRRRGAFMGTGAARRRRRGTAAHCGGLPRMGARQ